MPYLIIIVVFILIGLFFLSSMLSSNSTTLENSDDSFYEEENPSKEIKTVKAVNTVNLNLDTKEQLEKQIQDLIFQNRRIKAIKLYREYNKVGLKEAKDAVERISAIKPELKLNHSPDNQVKDLVFQNKKIQAIKLYREYHNVGLKEAKEAIDRMSVIKSEQELNNSSDKEIQELVTQGQKIKAIKLYRELYNVDLKTAYEEINKMLWQ